MLKKFFILAIIAIIILLITFGIINTSYCKDNTHRGVFPVNPYCTKCHGRDGIVQHKCSNPDGIDKFCSSCGKIVAK